MHTQTDNFPSVRTFLILGVFFDSCSAGTLTSSSERRSTYEHEPVAKDVRLGIRTLLSLSEDRNKP